MAQVDFYKMLSGLGDTIAAQRKEATRREALAGAVAPDGTVDFSKAVLGLSRVGDVEGAARLSQLANAAEDRAWRRSEAQRQQGNADRLFNFQKSKLEEEPNQIKILRAAGIDPSSPEGRKALFPRTDTPISATDKRAIFKAEDEIPAIQGTIENLSRALELNDNTFSGYSAGIRSEIGSKLPDWMVPDAVADQKGALATSEWSRIMGPESLQSMANTLKGATTDFELRKFIEMLGDPATPPSVRKSVIERMKRLSERKLEIEQSRVKDLRGGSYFKEGGGSSGVLQAPGAPRSGQITSKAQFDALPSGSVFIAPDGSRRVKP